MSRVIAIANQKGGVGKTTTAVNLSSALAELGCRVLLIDMDPQGNATSGVGVDKNQENTIYELLLGNSDFNSCVVHTEYENLDLLPANIDLSGVEIELLDIERREYRLKDELNTQNENYDFVIIDCPPSLNMLTVNAMTASDSVIVPIQCEYYALEGLSQLLHTINLVNERLNANLVLEGIVFTMYDGRTNLSTQVVKNVKDNLNARIYKTVIPRKVKLAEAPSYGMPINHYASSSGAAESYRSLAKEVMAVNGFNIKDSGGKKDKNKKKR